MRKVVSVILNKHTGCDKIFYPISNAHKIGTRGAIEILFAVKILSKFRVFLTQVPTRKSKVFFEALNKGSIALYDTSLPSPLIHIDFHNVRPIGIRCLRSVRSEIGSRTFETERSFRRTQNFDIPSVSNLENFAVFGASHKHRRHRRLQKRVSRHLTSEKKVWSFELKLGSGKPRTKTRLSLKRESR